MEQKLDIYTRILCDLCGKECGEEEDVKTLPLQPKRGMEKVDICEKCSREYCEKWKSEEVDNKKIAKMVASIKNIPTKK